MEEELNLNELKGNILDCIKNRNAKGLKEIFETVPTIDIAEAMDDVEDVAYFLYVFRVISSDYTGDFFSDLTSEQQESIITAFTDKELISLLENSFSDDIVDTLEEMPANLVTRVLKVAPPEIRKDINTLLNYKENTAGSVMTTEYIQMKGSLTVKEAIARIRDIGREAETIYTIFVRDAKRTLIGTIDLDDLIFSKDDEKLEDIMDLDFVTCNVNDDQEEVANMFKRYDLTAMAVVNNENKIIGIVTIDDVVDIIVEEATEDIVHLGQVTSMDDPYLKTPVWNLVLKCVPWILALMVLQVFSTWILSGFQEEIAKFALLSIFTPLLMDAGGNSGGQTTTIIVRSIALDEFGRGDLKKVIWKELRVAAIIAGIISTFAFGWLMFEMSVGIVGLDSIEGRVITNPIYIKLIIAGLVSSTLFITIIASRMVGCLLPFFAKAIKKDPAVMCGPLTTTIVDIVTLLTYFLLWTSCFQLLINFA